MITNAAKYVFVCNVGLPYKRKATQNKTSQINLYISLYVDILDQMPT